MTLPQPINGTETYLAAVYHRLGEMLERMPAPPEPPSDGTVELREPAQPKPADASSSEASEVELTEPKTDTAEDETDPASAAPARSRRKATRTRKGGGSS